MKILTIFLGVMLISGLAMASGDVEIHINYPADAVYTGSVNRLEIWIENDASLAAFSLPFSLTDYEGNIQWINPDSGFIPENDAIGKNHLYFAGEGLEDQALPDILMLVGMYFVPAEPALPINSSRACYYMDFIIPPGEPLGEFCVDNIFYYPGGDWLFVEEFGNQYPPNYSGCSNTSSIKPDCPKVCFPVYPAPDPVAQFTFAPDSGDAPLLVEFTDLSENYPTNWLWYFGDGQTSAEQNPVHEYQTEGTYFPKLVVSNSTGSDSTVSAIPVKVTTPVQPAGVSISCPAVKSTYSGIIDTIPYLVEYTGMGTDNFVLTVSDNQGWFLSPTSLPFSLEENSSTTIKVMVIVPEDVGYGAQNTITGVVTSQSNPSFTDMASCILEIANSICGDVNLDGGVDITDAVYIINYIFLDGPAPCEER